MENGVPRYITNEATGDMEMVHVPVTREQAYDMVRKEFYAIRHQQDIQRRVAAEEAHMVGAYFGKSKLEVGMQLEGETYDKFRAWAESQNEQINVDRASAYADYSSADEDKVAEDLSLLDSEDEPIAPAGPTNAT